MQESCSTPRLYVISYNYFPPPFGRVIRLMIYSHTANLRPMELVCSFIAILLLLRSFAGCEAVRVYAVANWRDPRGGGLPLLDESSSRTTSVHFFSSFGERGKPLTPRKMSSSSPQVSAPWMVYFVEHFVIRPLFDFYINLRRPTYGCRTDMRFIVGSEGSPFTQSLRNVTCDSEHQKKLTL
jgi:hypothetical protein